MQSLRQKLYKKNAVKLALNLTEVVRQMIVLTYLPQLAPYLSERSRNGP
jgi:hypothetical protein